MSIDITTESLLTLSQASKRVPGNPHVSSLHRWRLQGVHGVKLETVKIGGRRLTSAEALERFAARTTAAADGLSLPMRTSKQRARAVARANNEIGIDRDG